MAAAASNWDTRQPYDVVAFKLLVAYSLFAAHILACLRIPEASINGQAMRICCCSYCNHYVVVVAVTFLPYYSHPYLHPSKAALASFLAVAAAAVKVESTAPLCFLATVSSIIVDAENAVTVTVTGSRTCLSLDHVEPFAVTIVEDGGDHYLLN